MYKFGMDVDWWRQSFTPSILIRSLENSSSRKKTSSTGRKLTSGTAVQNSQIINAWTSVVGCRPVIPNDNNLLVTFKVPHRSYMSFASILLSPSPVGSSDNPITDVFHLIRENTEYTKGNCNRSHRSSSFRLEKYCPCVDSCPLPSRLTSISCDNFRWFPGSEVLLPSLLFSKQWLILAYLQCYRISLPKL